MYKKLLDNSKERYPFWKHWEVNNNITSSKSTSFFTVRVRAWPPTELPVEFSSSFHLPCIEKSVRAVDRGVWWPGVVYSSGRTRQKWLWYEARPLPPQWGGSEPCEEKTSHTSHPFWRCSAADDFNVVSRARGGFSTKLIKVAVIWQRGKTVRIVTRHFDDLVQSILASSNFNPSWKFRGGFHN